VAEDEFAVRRLDMGWDIILTTNKDVTEKDVDRIVSKLPEWMLGPFGGKQDWGWSLACDVHLDSPRKIRCGGSCGISGQIAEGFCEAFARRLEHWGYKVKIGEMSV
jgi:hypothetical protein